MWFTMGVFFFAHVFLGSHWMTAHRGSWTLTPCVCLWTQAGCCDLPVQKGGYCISSNLLVLGVATLLPLGEKHITQQNTHIIDTPLNGLVTIVTFLVLNHFFHLLFFFMMYVFLESFSSTSEGFRNVGWDSFTKCTLYVFSKPLGRPGCSHISSHSTDGLLFVFLFLPHHWSCMFVEVSYHYAVLQKL